jgi:hypothetical protein
MEACLLSWPWPSVMIKNLQFCMFYPATPLVGFLEYPGIFFELSHFLNPVILLIALKACLPFSNNSDSDLPRWISVTLLQILLHLFLLSICSLCFLAKSSELSKFRFAILCPFVSKTHVMECVSQPLVCIFMS